MSKKYTVKNVEYLKLIDENRDTYWKELGLNIDSLNETKLNDIDKNFEIELRKLTKSVLLEISGIFLGDAEEYTVNDIITSGISQDQKALFLLVKEFTLRKKRTIQEYVQYTKTTIEYTSEIALVWSLFNEAPNLLFEIGTYHNWRSRSTDKLYTFSKKQSEEKILKIAKEAGAREKLCNELYQASGQANFYKVYSYSNLKSSIIFHLYKKINDKTVPDFEQPIRNREVKSVMFSVDLEKKHVEIRDYTSKEKKIVLEFLSSMFNCDMVEVVSAPYSDFKYDSLKKSFLGIDKKENDLNIDDLLISAITFNRSSLPKSPLLHIELENDDVMEAVFQAHQSGIVDLKDLKDIKSLKLRIANTSRVIRAIPLESGDVIFSLDDSNLDKQTKELLGEKFKEKFFIPLNQPISNIYFKGGLEEKVDYLMGLAREELLDLNTKKMLSQLVEEKLIEKKKEKITYCPTCNETFSNELSECEECETKLKHRYRESLVVNQNKTVKYFEKKIKGFLKNPWSETRDSNINLEKEDYHFLFITNDNTGEEIRFYITYKQLTPKIINRIHRMVIPTIIIYVGSSDVNIDKYNDNCILTKNFGFFYVMENSQQFIDYMDIAFKEFLQRRKQLSAKSGLAAFQTIKQWKNDGGEYSDKEFEHDVFAIINDMTHNNVQWGAKFSGKIVPEGAFTLSYGSVKDCC